jgi:hypothetical protein
VGIIMAYTTTSYNTYMGKTVEELANDIEKLIFALGQMTGTVLKHKLDIEDEAYEEIMDELLAISNTVISKL